MYEEILMACKEWIYNIQILYADKLDIDIEVDNAKELVVNIDSDIYLGQLCISEPDFRPYNFVEFTILDINQDIGKVPAFWYGDREGNNAQEIIDNLNIGIKLLLQE